MAFAADTIVIWDPNAGSNNYGGGFAASLGGVRITSAVAYDDLVIDGADNTKISSAADRAFVANDRGNMLTILSGTGWTVQTAQIVSVAGGVATMDKAMGTVGSTAGTGNLGGYRLTWTDAYMELTVAGQEHHLWAKTGGGAAMTLGEAIAVTTGVGTATLPVTVRGRNDDGTANPTAANRPVIAQGAYAVTIGNYWVVEDIVTDSTAANTIVLGTGSWLKRCKVKASQTSPTTRVALSAAGSAQSISDCELYATGTAGTGYSGRGRVSYCYVHDCLVGVLAAATGLALAETLVETCGTLVSLAGYGTAVLRNCTLDNGTTVGISGGAATNVELWSSQITHCVKGCTFTANYGTNSGDYNNWHGNTNDLDDPVTWTKGGHDTATDPGYAAEAASFVVTGDCLTQGHGLTMGVG